MNLLRSVVAFLLLAAAAALGVGGAVAQWADRAARTPGPMREIVAPITHFETTRSALAGVLTERAVSEIPTIAEAVPGLTGLIEGLISDAVLAAARILSALDYVGVIGVEFFVTRAGLVVNEFAPRVHNSGHWTQNGCTVDQFEQHIRAIAGWPLGDGTRHADVVMENLIGDEVAAWSDLASERGTAIHLYGKAEARPGRKMGHVNRIIR